MSLCIHGEAPKGATITKRGHLMLRLWYSLGHSPRSVLPLQPVAPQLRAEWLKGSSDSISGIQFNSAGSNDDLHARRYKIIVLIPSELYVMDNSIGY